MDDYNDPAASETHDQDVLRAELERWRNEVKPADLRPPQRHQAADAAEPYWGWHR